jgi:hypothetical protein
MEKFFYLSYTCQTLFYYTKSMCCHLRKEVLQKSLNKEQFLKTKHLLVKDYIFKLLSFMVMHNMGIHKLLITIILFYTYLIIQNLRFLVFCEYLKEYFMV